MDNSISAASFRLPVQADTWDAVIVGAGAAGLYTALCLPQAWRVLLLTKDQLNLSASGWAQGGIAAAIAPGDSDDLHVIDTLKAGAGLCERTAVEFLVEHAPECIQSLVDLGVAFDRSGESLAMTREAAHSRPRVLHAADRTGKAVVTTLAEQVLQRENITVGSQVFVQRLWLEAGHCRGVAAMQEDRMVWLRSHRVILATGGGGQVFAHTTNPSLSTGDGIALAHQAGAALRDLEFFQFHPTALMKTGAPRFLISEAVRGEGAHLVDDGGDRFALNYHPDGELAPRDVVSRAIFQHLQQTGQDHVWLDLRPIPEAQIRHRFPNIIRVCQKWGVDLFEGPIPVSPAAHYWMGGIVTDHWGQTTVPGLYAVGETASTGVHGANRLASNSLLECIVFGRRLAQTTNADTSSSPGQQSVRPAVQPEAGIEPEQEVPEREIAVPEDWQTAREPMAKLRQELAEVLWSGAGICRDAAGMQAALARVGQLRKQLQQLPLSDGLSSVFEAVAPGERLRWCHSGGDPTDDERTGSDRKADQNETPRDEKWSKAWAKALREWGELNNLLTIGELILRSALFREESRGGHYRLDFPETIEQWRLHTLVVGERLDSSAPVSDAEA